VYDLIVETESSFRSVSANLRGPFVN